MKKGRKENNMLLKKKTTGEIGWLYCDHLSTPKKIMVFSEARDLSAPCWSYGSLAELNEEWEDMPEEEPKKYWRITDLGELKSVRLDQHHQNIEKCKDLGNYFNTRGEAELAVRKLKAWKRLKDKGFINEQVFSMNLNWCNPDDDDWKAFKLLFGGE